MTTIMNKNLIDIKLSRYYTNLHEHDLICKKCHIPLFDHSTAWEYDHVSTTYMYKDPCLKGGKMTFSWQYQEGQGSPVFGLSGNYNTFRIDGKWIHVARTNMQYMYALPFTEAMALEKTTSLIYPVPKILDTVGDVYNYFVGRDEGDVLKLISKKSTFRRMKQTALQRIIHPKKVR